MVVDFVSADFRWFRSQDGKRSARRVIKPGKNRDSYFSNEDILAQVAEAISILKWPEDALSARHMPKNPPKLGHNWGIEVSKQRRSKFERMTRNLQTENHSHSIFQKDTKGLVCLKGWQ